VEVIMSKDRASSEKFEKALMAFFKQPALGFSRKLRSSLDKDPDYLKHHAAEVFPQIQRYLTEAGIPLDGKNPEEQMRNVVREVVVRLRSFEKGRE
jgi:hypothetical protein